VDEGSGISCPQKGCGGVTPEFFFKILPSGAMSAKTLASDGVKYGSVNAKN